MSVCVNFYGGCGGASIFLKLSHLILTDPEDRTIKFEFLKQLNCKHSYRRDATFRQLKKDDDKVLWVCPKCNKVVERDRWNPPDGVKR
jgi:rubrerythrin